MISLQDARIGFMSETKHLFDEGEQLEIFSRCIDHITQLNRFTWKTNPSLLIKKEDLDSLIEMLKLNIPLQYCLGYEWFDDIKLSVNKHVLIPRPETYELVLWVQELVKKNNKLSKLIDLGTGSACIPIWLKHHQPHLQISALDISQEALHIAKQNAEANQCDIEFILDDMLRPDFSLPSTYDIIISNPPYITQEEKANMLPHVLEHEPNLALFVSNGDPLQFYKAICTFAKSHLHATGEIFLEINQAYAKEVMSLFEQNDFVCTLRHDLYENARMINASRKS